MWRGGCEMSRGGERGCMELKKNVVCLLLEDVNTESKGGGLRVRRDE